MKRTTVLTMLLALISCVTLAQAPVDTANKAVVLNETVISANRSVQSRATIAQDVQILRRSDIERTNAQSTADLLINSGAAFVQKSQQGGGSPVLRGFEASRILLVVDGVRMNNAIYRAGHLQNVITMDNAALERAEILFGPASTVYGTDALGGAICFYTKNPVFSDGGFKTTGSAFVRYGTVNEEKTGHVDFSLGGKRLAAITSFTYSDFGDLRMGKNPGFGGPFGKRNYYVDRIDGQDVLVNNSDPYVQKYSGYQQYDLMEKIVFQQSDRVRHTLNLQYSTSSNIPRYDRLTDPSTATGLASAEWYYGPQDRLMAAYSLRLADMGFFNQGLTVTGSYQAIEESRHNRNFGAPRRTSRIENVGVIGLTADAARTWGETHMLHVGVDAQYNDVTSEAFRTNVNTGEITTQSTRYPDGGSQMTNAALYATHQSGKNNWTFSQGARVGFSSLNASFVSREFYAFPFSDVTQSSPVASGSLGAVWNGDGPWRFSTSLSSGFRMPNVDDLAKVFDSQTGSVVVPNPDIKPEKTVNLDLNFDYRLSDRVHWEATVWGTLFRDAIVTDVFTFNGEDTITFNDTPSRVLASQNKRNARLYGFTTSLNADATDNVALFASVAFTRGEILEEGESKRTSPLDHIPPTYGRAGARWHKNGSFFEGFVLFNGKKRLEDYNLEGEDNLQYAPPSGMPEWLTVNFRGGYRISKYLTLQAGIDNLLDTQYRYFASGINAPGRNFWITARTSW
ncbi:MAG: TonB-dependent receptor [Chitinophagales bacterium]|nr:TonB-dependent receptor [Chitinophagales bacterium]